MSVSVQPWPTLPLRSLASEMCLGKMLDKAKNRGTLQPYLRNVNVRWFSFDLSDLKEMRFEEVEQHRFGLQRGDLVICEGGEPGRAAVWEGQTDDAKIQKALHRVRFRPDEYDPRFAMYFLRFGTITDQFAPYYTGTTIKHLTGVALSQIPFPVPPLKEQRRIVAAIESNLSRVDAGVAEIEKARAKLRRYRAAVLKAACEGRLVPTEDELARDEGRDYEPADRLLDRVAWDAVTKGRASARGKAKQDARELGDVSAEAEVQIPVGWVRTCIGSLAASMKNGLYKPVEAYTDEGGTACLRMYNIERGRIVWSNVKRMILNKAEVQDYLLEPGDLLVNRVNSRELVGKTAPIPIGLEQCVFESKNIRVRLVRDLVLPQMIAYSIEHQGRVYFNRNAQQVVGMASISQPQLSAFPILLPPMAEQLRIVAEVERRLSLIDGLEAAIATNLKRADRLRQSILKRAFEGKLVPQDPADEPAEALLARIGRAKGKPPRMLPGM